MLALGCAAPNRTRGTAPAPSEIYTIGEARYAEGKYEEAVMLWRHALLELPQTPGYDDLRHKLVLRMAYGKLMAWSQSGNEAHLDGAKQMLARYVAKHEELHGEGAKAERQRGEVYELLYEVESRMPEAVAEQEAEPEIAEAELDDAEPDEPVEAADPEPRSKTWGPNGQVRRIVVRGERPSVDDPATRARLRSDFANAFDGYVLAAPEVVEYHGPRTLVRAGLVKEIETGDGTKRRDGRALGRAVVTEARPAVRECFAAAYARNPGSIAALTVELSVDEGTVTSAKVVDGAFVDPLGELCMVEAFERTTITEPGAATVEVPLTVWMQGAVLFYELAGRSFPEEAMRLPDEGLTPPPDPAAEVDPRESPERGHVVY